MNGSIGMYDNLKKKIVDVFDRYGPDYGKQNTSKIVGRDIPHGLYYATRSKYIHDKSVGGAKLKSPEKEDVVKKDVGGVDPVNQEIDMIPAFEEKPVVLENGEVPAVANMLPPQANDTSTCFTKLTNLDEIITRVGGRDNFVACWAYVNKTTNLEKLYAIWVQLHELEEKA